jgi:DNA-binding GntR family transcriptional regulator
MRILEYQMALLHQIGAFMAKYKPLQEKAYEFLKDKITKGELEYGKFYSETKMAAEIGISRTPFKDALVRLSQDRYIDIVPSRGFCLHILSLQDITNTYQSRTAVEGFCALTLHTRRKEKEAAAVIEALFRDNENMADAVANNASFQEILSYDLSFHRRIVEFSKNDELISLYESHNHQLYDIAMKTFELEGRPSIAVAEHQAILDSLVSDDKNATADTYLSVMAHMDNTRDIVISLMS